MRLMQDEFVQSVIPRLEKKMKSVMVLSNRQGAPLTNESGEPIAPANPQSIDLSIKFMHTTAKDATDSLGLDANKDVSSRFPFVFIDSDKVSYTDDGNVNIGEMYIAALSYKEWTVIERDANNVRPILAIMGTFILDIMSSIFGTDYPFNPQMKLMYKGELDNAFKDYTDCIRFTNIKLRILQ